MEKIKITIPDNLNEQEELIAIAKYLGKKLLPAGKKAIGTGYELKHHETQITIKREPVEKPIVTRECSVCNSIFEDVLSKDLHINYGGKKKVRKYCSNECRDQVLEAVGHGRASIKRNQLKPVREFHKSR